MLEVGGGVATLNLPFRNGTKTAGTVVCTFNSTYAPKKNIYIPAIEGSTFTMFKVCIYPSGEVKIDTEPTTNISCNLSCSWHY